jgi:hypothetical protein
VRLPVAVTLLVRLAVGSCRRLLPVGSFARRASVVARLLLCHSSILLDVVCLGNPPC